MEITNIVIGTRNRCAMLTKTIVNIRARTHAPYQLRVIDDASTDDTVGQLRQLGVKVYPRPVQRGITQNLMDAGKVSKSELLVFTDDDALCPDVDPDWLARLLFEMNARPRLAMLALNNPSCNVQNSRHVLAIDGAVTFSEYVGGQFVMIRRELIRRATREFTGWRRQYSPVKALAKFAQANGGRVGYLTDTYTYHYGTYSQRTGDDLAGIMVEPVDMVTLAPPEEYRW